MTKEEALQTLKDNTKMLISTGDNEIELSTYCNIIKALEIALVGLQQLEKIDKLIDDCDSGNISCEQLFLFSKGVLEKEYCCYEKEVKPNVE